jgi:hypothetical protein
VLVIFVHGLTVRDDGRYQSLLKAVREGVQQELPVAHVDGCYWGDLGLGRFEGLSIPTGKEGQMGVGDGASGGGSVDDLRSLLIVDPDLELRLLQDPEGFVPATGGIDLSPPQVRDRNKTLLAMPPKLASALEAQLHGLLPTVPRSTVETEIAVATKGAAAAQRDLNTTDLAPALTRAITAHLRARWAATPDEERQPPDFPWGEVEESIALELTTLLGQAMGLDDLVKRGALNLLTPVLTRARPSTLKNMGTFIGDCFIYLKNRQVILDRMEKTIEPLAAAHPGPLWLIGHSMGGIISFDYASIYPRQIDRLVTVGSQVALFAELHSLGKVNVIGDGPQCSMPPTVKAWRNVYDEADILSFLAKPIFAAAVDSSFDTGAPFPDAHSAYWKRDGLYKLICAG